MLAREGPELRDATSPPGLGIAGPVSPHVHPGGDRRSWRRLGERRAKVSCPPYLPQLLGNPSEEGRRRPRRPRQTSRPLVTRDRQLS
jgi:hypothetical protein